MPDATSPPSPTTLPLGGRYLLRGEIARGGMAVVHRGIDEVLGRDVAVKLLHAHLADDEAFRDRFRREAREAAAISHPNVVSVYDWGESDGQLYLVMELIEGPSLRDVLVRRGRLAPAEVAALLTPVADALAVAHAQGRIHRDIKPENILIEESTGRVKVADFGLARAVAETTQTFGPDKLVGSPHYLAPEAVEGHKVDARSDVYQLGIVVFECLTGLPPFQGDSPLATALEHTRSQVPRPSQAIQGVDPLLDAVVARATARAPGDRYQDAAEMAVALHAAGGREGAIEVDLGGGRERSLTAIIPIAASETIVRSVPAGEPGPSPLRRRLLWLFALLVLTIGGGLALWATVVAPLTDLPPGLVGMREAEAVRAIEDAGFVPEIAPERVFDIVVPAGSVLATDPAERARKGATVVLTISAGPRMIALPEDLLGQQFNIVEQRLEGLNFEVERVNVFSETVEVGAVVRTDPPPGAKVAEASTVTVEVSKGREPITVPAVVGLTEADALRLIEEAGLVPEVVERLEDEDAPAGDVLAQSPGPDGEAFRGDTVQLTISSGPAKFEMPDVTGWDEADAVAHLEGLGLVVEVERVRGFFQPAGKVAQQDPRSGRKVKSGDKVTLFVWA